VEVDHCEFPDELYYDVGNDVWIRPAPDGTGTMGITTVLSFLAGKFTSIKLKTQLSNVSQNQAIATVESGRYFGPVRSPVSGQIAKFNVTLQVDPSPANSSSYESGWIAQFESFNAQDLAGLKKGRKAAEAIGSRIRELKVRCFKALPDEEMFSIGTECATTLANLNQLLEQKPDGAVVHLVTDDPTSDIEMIRWSDQTKNNLLESRKEGNLFHFIVQKFSEKAKVQEEEIRRKQKEKATKLIRRNEQ